MNVIFCHAYQDGPIRTTLHGVVQAGGGAAGTRVRPPRGWNSASTERGKAGAAAATTPHRPEVGLPPAPASPRIPRAARPPGQGRSSPPGAAAVGPGGARRDGAAAASSLTVVRHHGLALVQLLRGPQMVLDALELRRQRGQRRGRHGAGGGGGARVSLPGLARAASASCSGAVGGRAAGRGERPLRARRRRAGLSVRPSVRLSIHPSVRLRGPTASNATCVAPLCLKRVPQQP